MNIEIIIEDDNWNSIKVRKLINDATKSVFSYLKLQDDDLSISVLCTNDEEIRVLNKTYRGIDSSTNVLSFPMESDSEYDNFDYDEFDFDEDNFTDLHIENLKDEECRCSGECHSEKCSDPEGKNCEEKCHCSECSDFECDCHESGSSPSSPDDDCV